MDHLTCTTEGIRKQVLGQKQLCFFRVAAKRNSPASLPAFLVLFHTEDPLKQEGMDLNKCQIQFALPPLHSAETSATHSSG